MFKKVTSGSPSLELMMRVHLGRRIGNLRRSRARSTSLGCTLILSPLPSARPMPRLLCLDELLPDAPAVPAATAVVQHASGPDPAWLDRWVEFEKGLARDSELWEWVSIEEEEEKRMNSEGSLTEKEHVTDLVGLAHLHGLEESSPMHWIFECGEEEALVRAIDEKFEKLSLETESVVSEVSWQGEVLQVHSKISLKQAEKEKVRFLFRGPG